MFKIDECGYLEDKATIPVMMLNSLRGWHQKFIFVRGGDLEFLPTYKEKVKTDKLPTQRLGEVAPAKIYDFCGALRQ